MTKAWCKALDDYAVVAESGNRRVVMAKGLAKEFKKVANKDKAKLLSWMENWTRDREGAISTQRFKSQESFTDHKGRRVQIWAFKSFQARLYGFIRKIEDKETFLVTAADASKKDDEADPVKLKRASEGAFKVLDAVGMR